jgi:hypothetical protein
MVRALDGARSARLRRDVTLALAVPPRSAASLVHARSRMNQPNEPPKPPVREAPKPVNPDPKTHPIHREVPVQPIHQGQDGTDPKHPIKQAP